MRPIRAHEAAVRLPGKLPVGNIASPPGEHAGVFQPALVTEGLHGTILRRNAPEPAGRFARRAGYTLDNAIRMLQGA